MLTPADTYQIAHNSTLLLHHWETESVVYNTASGDTHLIDNRAALALQQIAENPISFASLKSKLLGHQFIGNHADTDIDLDAWLQHTLAQFLAIDLIEKVEGELPC